MIYSVTGIIAALDQKSVVIETGGLGLRVFVTGRTLKQVGTIGEQIKFFTHFHVSENDLSLYGFAAAGELSFFELLISISGVGPKSALAIMDVAALTDLKSAIIENRPDLLTRAAGIGAKTAQRIIIELKNKIKVGDSAGAVKTMEADADIIETLYNLGFSRSDSRRALDLVGREMSGIESRLKEALKILKGR